MYRLWWFVWILPGRFHEWFLDRTGIRLVRISKDGHLYSFYWVEDWSSTNETSDN